MMGDMEDAQRRCKYFEKGNCKNESSCRFLHVSSGDPEKFAMDMKQQRLRNCEHLVFIAPKSGWRHWVDIYVHLKYKYHAPVYEKLQPQISVFI